MAGQMVSNHPRCQGFLPSLITKEVEIPWNERVISKLAEFF